MKLISNSTIREYQDFIKAVYGKSNAQHFNSDDMLVNVERFLMRAIKGIRKEDKAKTIENVFISMSWFMSLMNQYHIDVEDIVWNRFPYLCSYCGSVPCSCKKVKVENRKAIVVDESKRPHTIREFQTMFWKIYPPEGRTPEHAGIHLAEEMGELSEAFLAFKGTHSDADFANIILESSDLVSCFFSVCNSFGIDIADEFSKRYSENCHICHELPCSCTFSYIMAYKS